MPTSATGNNDTDTTVEAGAYDDVDAEGELDVLATAGRRWNDARAGVGKRYRPAPAKTF
ncbi:hypothetical protein DFH09DRAFT_1350287 [Mycena vulgaris]|nr:hypothetical protein DFH09DRAFT_1350287 [Mycena vulgaris]